jgi:hypothetical protein
MLRAIEAHVDAGAEGLEDTVAQAVQALRQSRSA